MVIVGGRGVNKHGFYGKMTNEEFSTKKGVKIKKMVIEKKTQKGTES